MANKRKVNFKDFVNCPDEYFENNDSFHQNSPVNMRHIVSFSKITVKGLDIPGISFVSNTKTFEWWYSNEIDRDHDFKEISVMYGETIES